MVGFYGGAPLEYAGINEQGSDAVPSSTGAVLGAAFGEGLAHNFMPRLERSRRGLAAETGFMGLDERGEPILTEPEPPIDPATANAEYGIRGHLTFDAPVPRSIAQDLRYHHQEKIERDDVIARAADGLLSGGAARFTASLAAGILDPLVLPPGLSRSSV